MKKVFTFLTILILLISLSPSKSLAYSWGTYLPNSGTGSSVARTYSVTGLLAENCNGVYDARLHFTAGAYNTSSFNLKNHTVIITSISKGFVQGGMSTSYNTENSNTVVYDNSLFGQRLYQGTYYTVNWNRNIPLGPVNRSAAVGISTISGLDSSTYACGTEVWQTWVVGGSQGYQTDNSYPTSPQSINLAENLIGNSLNLESSLQEDFKKSNSSIKLDNVLVDQYLQTESEDVLSVIQQKAPVIFNNLDEHQFIKKQYKDILYEIAYHQNSANEDLITIKYQQDDMYIAIVSSLNEDEVLYYLDNK
ncbi:hypothetical protein [Metasolibacillus sp.]|uniref:hypothetical protein n=1 Tax=Metasolibacillus sp. TaxID=2703680 RepID=UPI0025FF7185|nr:hypothetical protein [Metasolibacillus sp.]MCT6925818.1 hypothetical protein [Metasolibacillus sp.]MCT6941926.1 hypothetical protein [Metasolibacillus sp.]